ncbi:hypothetical protein DY000_02059837 [Brassica cretica]|uniref:Uncharacterized protein n=1 Tax=Brassica cretica TaxID=69181 RepID=A0ABQ7APH9_BRACR|nr:hypothetical protein DY000_02059837 [Brassica cretica]
MKAVFVDGWGGTVVLLPGSHGTAVWFLREALGAYLHPASAPSFVSNVTVVLYSVCNYNTTDGGVPLHSQVGGTETTITDGWHDENAVGFVYLNDRHCETSHEVDIRGAENPTGCPDATVDEGSTMDSTPLPCQTETVVSIDSKSK